MLNLALPASLTLLLLGCAAAPPESDEVCRIRDWEASLRMELVWHGNRERIPENAVLKIHADDLPRFGEHSHFVGQTYVECDGFLVFMGDISDSHSNLESSGVMQWYRSMRSGIFKIHYRYTFYRSYSIGPNYQDRFLDWVVLRSGVRTITLNKG